MVWFDTLTQVLFKKDTFGDLIRGIVEVME